MHAIEGQLAEIKSAQQQTDRLIEHAGTQSTAARDSLDLSRDTAKKQLRAYVCVDSAVVTFPQPDVPKAQVHFRNSGQTPAYDCWGWINTWFAEHPLNEALPSPPSDFKMATEVLAPGRTSIFIAPSKPPLATQWLALLGTPKLTLYVYGEVHYREAFGGQQSTEYRLICGGPEGIEKVPGKEEWRLMADIEGNKAT